MLRFEIKNNKLIKFNLLNNFSFNNNDNNNISIFINVCKRIK